MKPTEALPRAAPLPTQDGKGGWQKIFGLPLALTVLFLALVILMIKMEVLLTHYGKDADLDSSLSARLGLTRNNQQWVSRQIVQSIAAQPGVGHSFSVSRDGKEQDILIGLHTPTRLYVIRSHRDGTAAGEALVTDAKTGQTVPLGAAEAQACLNEEFGFWAHIADQLMAAAPKS